MSTKNELSTLLPGPLTYASPAGPTSKKNFEKIAQKTALMAQNCKCIASLFSLFCHFFFFASLNKQFAVGSHNLHGFRKSSEFHKQCIQNYTGVWFAQELWYTRKTPLRHLSTCRSICRPFRYGGIFLKWHIQWMPTQWRQYCLVNGYEPHDQTTGQLPTQEDSLRSNAGTTKSAFIRFHTVLVHAFL